MEIQNGKYVVWINGENKEVKHAYQMGVTSNKLSIIKTIYLLLADKKFRLLLRNKKQYGPQRKRCVC